MLALTFIYKTICFVFKSVFNSKKPLDGNPEPATIKSSSERLQKKSKSGSAVHDSITRLDRKNQEKVGNWSKTHPVNPDPKRHQSFEWIQRERNSPLVENSYKVKRRCTPTPPTLDMISKPFRHKRASWVLEHEASKKI